MVSASARTITMHASDDSLLAPFAEFYAAAGRTLPAVQAVHGAHVPPALRALLGAPEPLTPRLEDRHGERLTLKVLERRRRGERYARRVVLTRGDGVPIVLGAIAINLARLTKERRAEVLAEATPFGHILADAVADPDALLRVACDPLIADALGLDGFAGWLYGRRRTLSDATATIATVVEILAPEHPRARVGRTGS
jgi:chorismate-pyruvate lyase